MRKAKWQEALARLRSGSFLRFFGASLFGLALDVALAAFLNSYAGLPLIGAAAVSLIVVAGVMYFVHEFWTFRSDQSRVSTGRMAGTVGSAALALAARSGCLYATSSLLGLGERWAVAQLVLAAGVSFILNYLIVRRIISGHAAPPRS